MKVQDSFEVRKVPHTPNRINELVKRDAGYADLPNESDDIRAVMAQPIERRCLNGIVFFVWRETYEMFKMRTCENGEQTISNLSIFQVCKRRWVDSRCKE